MVASFFCVSHQCFVLPCQSWLQKWEKLLRRYPGFLLASLIAGFLLPVLCLALLCSTPGFYQFPLLVQQLQDLADTATSDGQKSANRCLLVTKVHRPQELLSSPTLTWLPQDQGSTADGLSWPNRFRGWITAKSQRLEQVETPGKPWCAWWGVASTHLPPGWQVFLQEKSSSTITAQDKW